MRSLRQRLGLSFRLQHAEAAACACLLVSYRPLANIACLLRALLPPLVGQKIPYLYVQESLSTHEGGRLHAFAQRATFTAVSPSAAPLPSPSAEAKTARHRRGDTT